MKKIDGELLKEMLINAGNHLYNCHIEIDALNVFPVPDGDTGTNMNLTFSAGVKEIQKLQNADAKEVAKVFAKGLLMGARGNSGVILSQIFRGFSDGISKSDVLDGKALAQAFFDGSRVAYKAVMRPTEGTILTVVRETADYAVSFSKPEHSVEEVLNYILFEAEESLARTPELLPILKETGLVDSGGYGLVRIIEGMNWRLEGKIVERNAELTSVENTVVNNYSESDEFGYCTEFIVRLDKPSRFNENYLKNILLGMGDSLAVVRDEEILKVHIHTLKPGDVLNFGQEFGEFVTLKIENMQEQHTQIQQQTVTNQKDEYAIIAVASGEGLANAFSELRVKEIITGGQTMNPSTEDFVQAIKNANAKKVILLPNNSNILLAATQALELMQDEVEGVVIPTKTFPEGLSACLLFTEEASLEQNEQAMLEAVSKVKTGQITYAVKDTSIDGVTINKDDYMGIVNKKIICSIPDQMKVFETIVEQMIDDDTDIVTLIFGEDLAEEHKEIMLNYIEENYDIEVEEIDGKQSVYPLIIGVE